MPFHLAGWLESVDPAGAFNDLTALADQRLFTQGDNIRVPALNNIVALAGGAENTVAPRLRIYSPTIEQFARFDVTPLNVAAAAAIPPNDPHRLMDLLRNPLVVGVDEMIRAELNSNPAAAQIQWALAWFADGPIAPIEGAPIYTVRGTGATALVAGAWTAVNLTLDDELPPGTYAVVGARFQSATVIAGRLNFIGGEQQWRPGALGSVLADDLCFPYFRFGGMGVWGEFPFTQLPQAEFLASAADAAEVVHLDLVRVG